MAKITVNSVYCKGCGYCLDVCPKETLRISKNKNAVGIHTAEQYKEEECIACKLCAVICPESAITVYK